MTETLVSPQLQIQSNALLKLIAEQVKTDVQRIFKVLPRIAVTQSNQPGKICTINIIIGTEVLREEYNDCWILYIAYWSKLNARYQDYEITTLGDLKDYNAIWL